MNHSVSSRPSKQTMRSSTKETQQTRTKAMNTKSSAGKCSNPGSEKTTRAPKCPSNVGSTVTPNKNLAINNGWIDTAS